MVNFTNTTSTALWTVSAPYGIVSLSFSSTRVDNTSDEHDDYNPYDNGNFVAIALNTSNPKLPTFMFANGSKIEWTNKTTGYWAIAASRAERGVQPEFKWLVLELFVEVGAFVLFFF